jgi:hypothetical protein
VVQDPHTQGDAAVPATGWLPVELHVASEEKVGLLDGDALQRGRSLPGHPALTVLAPPDQLWNLLCHVAQSHLNRQGNVRDVLLTASAGAACTDDERRLVARRVDEHADRAPLRRNLAFALAFAGGSRPADPFERIAAVNYLLGARASASGRRGRQAARPDLNPAFALLSPGLDRRSSWVRSQTDIPPSPRPALRRLRRHVPVLERVIRAAAVFARLAGAFALAALAPLLVLVSRRGPAGGS